MIRTKITFEELKFLIDNNKKVNIETTEGYSPVIESYYKYGFGKEIFFSDNTSIKCANQHLIRIDDKWKSIENCVIGESINGKIIKNIREVDDQEWIDISVSNTSNSYIVNDISHHNSGKSYIQYGIIQRILEELPENKKILFLVGKVDLVQQMFDDFVSYSKDYKEFIPTNEIHIVKDGEKYTDKRIMFSTWQAIYKEDPQYFKQFYAILGDEVHTFKATSLKSIVTYSTNAVWKIGLTGTLEPDKIETLTLTSIFGDVVEHVKASDLIDDGTLSDLEIKMVQFLYPDKLKKTLKSKTKTAAGYPIYKMKYGEENDFLLAYKPRNNAITEFVLQADMNSLVLFRYRNHGKDLERILQEKIEQRKINKKVLYIDGMISPKKRKEIRQLMETENNLIVVASYDTTSTGINVKNLHYIFLAHGYKSPEKVIQSIGRSLRTNHNKEKAIIVDFFDDLVKGLNENYSYIHGCERRNLYIYHNYPSTIHKFQLE